MRYVLDGSSPADWTIDMSSATEALETGTFLAHTDRARERWGLFVRRVRGNRFGKPRRISAGDPLAPQPVQWPDGALTVVWTDGSRTLARSSRAGRRWSRARRLFTGNEPSGLRVAAGRRGGWIVWDGDPALSTSDQPIRILRLRRPPLAAHDAQAAPPFPEVLHSDA